MKSSGNITNKLAYEFHIEASMEAIEEIESKGVKVLIAQTDEASLATKKE